MNWVAENGIRPAIASMSLGGGASSAMDRAVATMHNAGVVVSVAAGNSNANACNYSPARATEVCQRFVSSNIRIQLKNAT